MHYAEFVLMDCSGSEAGFRVHVGAITPVSLPGFLVQLGFLRGSLNNITLGTISHERWVGDETVLNNVPPNDPMAQRELKWRVYMFSSTLKTFTMSIATPDLSLLVHVPFRGDFADLSNPNVQAFVTALEEIVVDPINQQGGCVVHEIVLIGRNN